jgi:hypothetical protein
VLPVLLFLAPKGALTALPLAGPFPTLAAYCQAQASPKDCDPDTSGLLDGPSVVDDTGAGLHAAHIFVTHTDAGNRCNLGVAGDQGWYVLPEIAICSSRGTTRTYARASQLALTDVVPGGSRELLVKLVEFGEGTDYAAGGDAWVEDFTAEKLIVCGMSNAAGGAPSCLAPITVGFRKNRNEVHADKGTHSYKFGLLDVTFKDGALVGAKTDSKMSDDQIKLIGTHPLVFP